MLLGLTIQNLILVEAAALSFTDGFTAITGETGAGKSALLHALALTLGRRAEARLVRSGAAQGSVTARFHINKSIQEDLAQHDLPTLEDDTILLRRVLKSDGKSQAYINDTPVSLGLLQQLGEGLALITGQFATQRLRDSGWHRQMLDGFGGHADDLATLKEAYQTWRTAEAAFEAARQAAASAAARRDSIQLQHDELSAFAPETTEHAALTQQRQRLRLGDKLRKLVSAGKSALEREAMPALNDALSAAESITNLEVETAAPGYIKGALAEVDEALRALRSLSIQGGSGGAGKRSLDELEERLFGYSRLARKYNCAVEDLEALLKETKQALALAEGDTAQLAALEEAAIAGFETYAAQAKNLSAKRGAAAKTLTSAVNKELPTLRLKGAALSVSIDVTAPEAGGPSGLDTVRFEAQMNPDGGYLPIDKAASGGELARLQLALTLAVSGRDSGRNSTSRSGCNSTSLNSTSRLFVFDEIDSGVGGETAHAIGQRLKALANSAQVLSITHSPQVAAQAHGHLLVRKVQSGQQAMTQITPLARKEARREELARMLAGAQVTEEARKAAAALMSG